MLILERARIENNIKKKKIKLLTKEQQEFYENKMYKYVIFEKKKSENKYCKVIDHCHYSSQYRVVAHRICNLKYSVPKKILIVFHNGSNHHYHFIIIEFEEFKKQFTIYLFKRKH